jgi:BON domain
MGETRDEIRLGGRVEDLGGWLGRLTAVTLDQKANHLVAVRLSVFPLRETPVSADAIAYADGEIVRLVDGWDRTRMREPAETSLLELGKSTIAWDFDGHRAGRLEFVCYERESREVTGFVLRRSRVVPDRRLVPRDRVLTCWHNAIDTDLGPDEWARLRPFEADSRIREKALEALENDGRIDRLSRAAIEVSVEDQRVTLRGHLRWTAQKGWAVEDVRPIPGVVAVDEQIVSDDDLEIQVAQAIATQLRNQGELIQVKSFWGRVDLYGEATPGAPRIAEATAQRVPGVVAVHNYIRTVPDDAQAASTRAA